jgi:Protein of unknown function (DUF1524)
MSLRKRRITFVVSLLLILLSGLVYDALNPQSPPAQEKGTVQSVSVTTSPALDALSRLEVKGRAPKTDYSRKQFFNSWADTGDCDMRNYILKRDMTAVIVRSESDCTVMQGVLQDPYTGKTVQFVRSPEGSDDVQIDHVVALSNAWQTGAQLLTYDDRNGLANDPLNLLAVDGPANVKKGDSDAATWLPPNKDYRCRYVARQIAVKQKYRLWITVAEKGAMQGILNSCPDQQLPQIIP